MITMVLVSVGLVAFAVFETCDPLNSGQIQTVDQIIPYTAEYLLNDIPGLLGLYISAIVCALLR